jgi:hypothetical protein
MQVRRTGAHFFHPPPVFPEDERSGDLADAGKIIVEKIPFHLHPGYFNSVLVLINCPDGLQ